MGAKFFVLFAIISCWVSFGASEQGVPLLMWTSSGSLPVSSDLSKSCKPTAEDLKMKVFEAIDKVDNVLLFLQDMLSVEDFSKYGKAAYTYLSSTFDGEPAGHLFLPRVSGAADASLEALGRSRKVTEINEAADGLRIVNLLKSSPRNLIVVRLKTASGGRLDGLIEKDERIRRFVEAAASKTDKFVAILTGEKPVPIDMKRTKRQARKPFIVDGDCVDISAESVKIITGSKAKVAADAKKTIDVPDQNGKLVDEDCTSEISRSVTFGVDTHDADISNVKLTFDFVSKDKEWELQRVLADYESAADGQKKEELTAGQKIMQKHGKAYNAHNPVEFMSKDKKFSLLFENIAVNPFSTNDEAIHAKVRAAETVKTGAYFSIPILSALTVGILFMIIMFWALDNITSIKTMDQFDDPRGKTITVPVTD